jgi:hypothetical protein
MSSRSEDLLNSMDISLPLKSVFCISWQAEKKVLWRVESGRSGEVIYSQCLKQKLGCFVEVERGLRLWAAKVRVGATN